MPLEYPRDFTEITRWASPQLSLEYQQELSGQVGGLIQGKDLGPPLWRAQFSSVPLRFEDADAAMAQFRGLQGVSRTFLLYPPLRFQPAATVASELVGGSYSVHLISQDRDQISIDGLPAGFEMRAGDFLSIRTQNAATEFIQLITGATANGAGETPYMDVVPYIRPSVLGGDVVSLLRPKIEMRLVPGSLDDPQVDATHRRIDFQAVQVVR